MIKKQTIVIVLLVTLIISMLTGCGHKRRNLAREVLEERYGEEFELEGDEPAHDFDIARYAVHPVNNPDLLFTARVDPDDNSVTENYVSRLVCKQFANDIASKMTDLDGDKLVVVEPMFSASPTSNKDITIEEYVKNNASMLSVTVFYVSNTGEPEPAYNALNETMSQYPFFSGNASIVYLTETDLNTFKERLAASDAYDVEYANIINGKSCGSIRVVDGEVMTSYEDFKAMFENMAVW